MIGILFLIAISGASVSILRHLIHYILSKKIFLSFTSQTFFVYIVGWLLIGILVGYFSQFQNGNELSELILVMLFYVGFTIFSTFGLKDLIKIKKNQLALLYTNYH